VTELHGRLAQNGPGVASVSVGRRAGGDGKKTRLEIGEAPILDRCSGRYQPFPGAASEHPAEASVDLGQPPIYHAQFSTRSYKNFGGLVLSGNLDQTITQLNAPHDFWPQRHEPS
jgi:hypothetical protein